MSCSRRRWEDRACGVRQCDFNSHCASSTSACSKRCSDDLSVQAGLLAAGLLRFDGSISCGVKELSKVVDNFFLVLRYLMLFCRWEEQVSVKVQGL